MVGESPQSNRHDRLLCSMGSATVCSIELMYLRDDPDHLEGKKPDLLASIRRSQIFALSKFSCRNERGGGIAAVIVK